MTQAQTLSVFPGDPADEPRLAPEVRCELEAYFKNLVTQLSLANAHSGFWWASWLSSRDRFLSVLWTRLVALQRLLVTLAERSPQPSFAAPDLGTAQVARDLARALGYRVRTDVASRLRFASDAIGIRLSSIVRLVKTCWWAISWIRLARKYPIAPEKLATCDRLIITMLGANIDDAERYVDTYFGDLHGYFDKLGIRSAYCGNIQAHPRAVIPRLQLRAQGPTLTTFGHFLKWRDVLSALREVATSRINTSVAPDFHGASVDRLVRADLSTQSPSIFLARLLHRAAPRLLAAAPKAEIIHMFENNPWERAIYQAAAGETPRRRVTGFLHCAVLPSHFKNYIAPDEWGIRPMPHRIVCTGPAALRILSSLGAYPAEMLRPGCDLRGASLEGLTRHQRTATRAPTVLLILEGLRSMWRAVHWAEQVVAMNPTLQVRIREHPAMKLAEIARINGRTFKLGPRLQLEPPCSLAQSLAGADVVAYVSSTAALYAVHIGMPVVKIWTDDSVNDDPLVQCDSLKRQATSPEAFAAAIDELVSLPTDVYATEARQAAAYIEDYLTRPSDKVLSVFHGQPA